MSFVDVHLRELDEAPDDWPLMHKHDLGCQKWYVQVLHSMIEKKSLPKEMPSPPL